jgi:GNAT superfamily N-acetyltransferase
VAVPELLLRRLGPGDGDVLRQLAADAAAFDLEGASGADRPLSPAQAEAYLAQESVVHWVAVAEGRVIGELLCHLLPMPHGDGAEVLLYSIGVREGWRRRGVGSALVACMNDWMSEQRLRTVWVLADNPGAQQFYRACGFGPDPDEEDVVYLIRTTAQA